MILVIIYSFLLIAGMAISQALNVTVYHDSISVLTTFCLAYIMIEVGLEFNFDRSQWRGYLKDFGVAMSAAILPATFLMIYILYFFQLQFKEAALVGLSAAPTSAGILFAMLSAAGLSATWVFKKARILAIADDLGTLLLMIPLKIVFTGFHYQLLIVICLIAGMSTAAVRWFHRLTLPTGKLWLFLYAGILVIMAMVLEFTTHVHLEILWPSFILGCLLLNTHNSPDLHWADVFDKYVKGTFMFLVGCSLPKLEIGSLTWGAVAGHLFILLLLSNLGKCFPLIAYRKTVSFRERLALSFAMFPRGEVGAGVLLIALSYGIQGIPVGLAVGTLALNLLLTGFFIVVVIELIRKSTTL